MPPEKLITLSHLSRSVPQGKKKPSLMHETGTTVYHSPLMIDTTPHLLLLGAVIDIIQPLKATLPQVMDDTMKSLLQSPTKQNVWMTPYYGRTQSRRASSKQKISWTHDCGRHGITLNPQKFRSAQDEVEFAGFEITKDTVRPCKKYIRAIAEFPAPRSLTDIRSLFGLVNQV